jgi:hypothetical protein
MIKFIEYFSITYTTFYIIAVVNTYPEIKTILMKNSTNSVKKGNEIINSKLVICDDKNQNCQAIENFHVSENNTLGCYQSEIEILFSFGKDEVSGFLTDGLSHIVKTSNEMTNICKKLRRLGFLLIIHLK